jgi:putative oxidoreductase
MRKADGRSGLEEKNMKIASTISRYLLGVIFLTFGLNGFLHFIPMPPPAGVAGQFFGALFVSRLYVVIFALQIVPAILLLVNRYVPLALTILAAIIFNILSFHIFMAPAGLPLAIFVAVLWVVAFINVRQAFSGLFQSRFESRT